MKGCSTVPQCRAARAAPCHPSPKARSCPRLCAVQLFPLAISKQHERQLDATNAEAMLKQTLRKSMCDSSPHKKLQKLKRTLPKSLRSTEPHRSSFTIGSSATGGRSAYTARRKAALANMHWAQERGSRRAVRRRRRRQQRRRQRQQQQRREQQDGSSSSGGGGTGGGLIDEVGSTGCLPAARCSRSRCCPGSSAPRARCGPATNTGGQGTVRDDNERSFKEAAPLGMLCQPSTSALPAALHLPAAALYELPPRLPAAAAPPHLARPVCRVGPQSRHHIRLLCPQARLAVAARRRQQVAQAVGVGVAALAAALQDEVTSAKGAGRRGEGDGAGGAGASRRRLQSVGCGWQAGGCTPGRSNVSSTAGLQRKCSAAHTASFHRCWQEPHTVMQQLCARTTKATTSEWPRTATAAAATAGAANPSAHLAGFGVQAFAGLVGLEHSKQLSGLQGLQGAASSLDRRLEPLRLLPAYFLF
mgnify:CR=1 FL=1